MKAILEAREAAEARMSAVECAQEVLKFYEKARPNDKRPRRAIAAARKYAQLCLSEEANEAQIEEARYALMWAGHDAAEAAIEAILLNDEAAHYAAYSAAFAATLANRAREAVEAALNAAELAAKEVEQI